MPVRVAQPSDAEAIAAIHVTSWQTTYRGIVPDDELDAMTVADKTALWREILSWADPGCFISEDDRGDIVGFAHGRLVAPDDESPTRDPDGRPTGFITSVHVLQSAKGSGLGMALMAALAGDLGRRGAGKIWLEVAEENRSAIGFYDRLSGRAESRVTCGGMESDVPALVYIWPDAATLIEACAENPVDTVTAEQ